MKVTFFEKDGKLQFSIPENKELEDVVRATIKTKSIPVSKNQFFFRRGVQDACNAIVKNQPRKYGTPVVIMTDALTGHQMTKTANEAKEFLQDVGGNWNIKQVSGSLLPVGYFEENHSL